MTINTDSSSALLRANYQGSDNNQRRSSGEQNNGRSPDQDTVTLSGQIMAGLAGSGNSEERIATLRQQYENGTYQPSLQDLAGRILDIHL
jgi:anti-sigma28 factor (negative regulator of flagellin synthesis)